MLKNSNLLKNKSIFGIGMKNMWKCIQTKLDLVWQFLNSLIFFYECGVIFETCSNLACRVLDVDIGAAGDIATALQSKNAIGPICISDHRLSTFFCLG